MPLTENEYNIKNTTDFAAQLQNRTLDKDEILVSYDVSSLFTEVPLDETFDHIIDAIYERNMLPQLSSKLIFRRLLNSVTRNTVFSFNGKLYRQTDGCGMGNPLSPVLANIFMSKLEADVVRPFNPTFYDRYVDDCFSKKRKRKLKRKIIEGLIIQQRNPNRNKQVNCYVAQLFSSGIT